MSTETYEERKYIGAGQSSVLFEIKDEKILKEYCVLAHGEIERRAYERLGSHPNIAKYIGKTEDGSIILEKGELLRDIIKKSNADEILLQNKICWLRDAATGLKHVHEKGIIHADVGCNNMILTKDGCLKLIDFAGCCIDGDSATASYEWFSYRQLENKISIESDIFAYGCFIYEIMTGMPPYYELEQFADRMARVERLYRGNQFPNLAHVLLGDLVQKCWNSTFKSMTEVSLALEAISPRYTEDELNLANQRTSKTTWTY